MTHTTLPDVGCPFCAARINPDDGALCAHVQLVLDENHLRTLSLTLRKRIEGLGMFGVRDFGEILHLAYESPSSSRQASLDALRLTDPSAWEAARDDVVACETTWDIAMNLINEAAGNHVRLDFLWGGRSVILFFSPEAQEIRPIEARAA
jgi:hypothetical protein